MKTKTTCLVLVREVLLLTFLSNGFKIRIDPQSINTDGQEYIYAAFAEHPFKTARAR